MNGLPINQVICGAFSAVTRSWPAESVNFVMFSPPYWGLRDYGENVNTVWGGDSGCEHEWGEEQPHGSRGKRGGSGANHKEMAFAGNSSSGQFCSKCGAWYGQLGLEPVYTAYIRHLVEVGREIMRVLRKDGSWYLNLGDTYAGSWQDYESRSGGQRSKDTESFERKGSVKITPPTASVKGISAKCKLLIPYRVALALIDDGWTCRNDITWFKPNAMPSSVKDRLTCHTERVFHLVKSKKYYYDLDAIREPHKVAKERFPERKVNYKHKTGPELVGSSSRTHFQGDEATAWDLLGKNPGDVVQLSEREQAMREFFKQKGSGGNPGHGIEGSTLGTTHELGKNPGDFWPITTQPFPDAHFAVYPEALCERPIKSSCPVEACAKCGMPYHNSSEIVSRYTKREVAHAPRSEPTKVDSTGWQPPLTTPKKLNKACNCGTNETAAGIVLDPMCGAGTTLVVAKRLGRRWIGIDLNRDYCEMARKRLGQVESPLEAYSGGLQGKTAGGGHD